MINNCCYRTRSSSPTLLNKSEAHVSSTLTSFERCEKYVADEDAYYLPTRGRSILSTGSFFLTSLGWVNHGIVHSSKQACLKTKQKLTSQYDYQYMNILIMVACWCNKNEAALEVGPFLTNQHYDQSTTHHHPLKLPQCNQWEWVLVLSTLKVSL